MTLPDWKSSDIWGPRICKPCEILDGLVRGKAGWACLFRELGVWCFCDRLQNSDGFMILMSCRVYCKCQESNLETRTYFPHQFSAHTTRKFRKTLASPEREFPNFSTSAVQKFRNFCQNLESKCQIFSNLNCFRPPSACRLSIDWSVASGSSGVKWGTAHDNMMILFTGGCDRY